MDVQPKIPLPRALQVGFSSWQSHPGCGSSHCHCHSPSGLLCWSPQGWGQAGLSLPGAGGAPAQEMPQPRSRRCPSPGAAAVPALPSPTARLCSGQEGPAQSQLQGANCPPQPAMQCLHGSALQTVQIWVQFNRLNYMCSSSGLL